jgi:hypothetical protein
VFSTPFLLVNNPIIIPIFTLVEKYRFLFGISY